MGRHSSRSIIYCFDKLDGKINNNSKSNVTVGTEGNIDAFLNALMPAEQLEVA
jgi:hypothetical protein